MGHHRVPLMRRNSFLRASHHCLVPILFVMVREGIRPVHRTSGIPLLQFSLLLLLRLGQRGQGLFTVFRVDFQDRQRILTALFFILIPFPSALVLRGRRLEI